MSEAKKDTVGYRPSIVDSRIASSGIIQPGANPDPMEKNRQEMLQGLRNMGSSILDTITGRKRNVSGNNMSPSTTKDH